RLADLRVLRGRCGPGSAVAAPGSADVQGEVAGGGDQSGGVDAVGQPRVGVDHAEAEPAECGAGDGDVAGDGEGTGDEREGEVVVHGGRGLGQLVGEAVDEGAAGGGRGVGDRQVPGEEQRAAEHGERGLLL